MCCSTSSRLWRSTGSVSVARRSSTGFQVRFWSMTGMGRMVWRGHRLVPMADRYTIISADCHAGANHATYREYLSKELQEKFDEWRGGYKNPFRDLQDDGRSRNWDDDRRISEMDSDG